MLKFSIYYLRFLLLFLIFFSFSSFANADTQFYDFKIEREHLKMKDGVGIAMTYYLPVPKNKGERFPVLFELLPYRKDDLFALRDYSLYTYFVRRGYVLAKADVRGTGSSEGKIPPREYSEEELQDAVEIINKLSQKTWSNGNVGMWGISWGGFNAIQVAMRRPYSLKAIFATDASDDLYKDDVHYIDGIFHADEYELSIENDLSLPRYPDYRIDADYFKNRFEAYPWFLTYKKQQMDGTFWRKNSLRWQYDKINIPVYLIGGLSDGYKDSVPRMLKNLKVPLKAVLGPWNHAWPDDGVPGPLHEWRDEILSWWDYWLKGKPSKLSKESRFSVFVREGDTPDINLETASGKWRLEDWPISRTILTRWYPDGDKKLLSDISLPSFSPQPSPRAGEGELGEGEILSPQIHQLKYNSGAGTAAGYWWGETPGDMSEDDAYSLVYDSPVLKQNIEIIGLPKVSLRVSADAKLAHWIVRLEDVYPDGKVALVSGGAINGAQRDSRLKPSYLEPGKVYDIAFELHFTTWTFKPGHKIRMAVTNAQFPMLWPTPYNMTTKLYAGDKSSYIELPVIPYQKRSAPDYKKPKPREQSPYGKHISEAWPKFQKIIRNTDKSIVSMEWEGENSFELEGRTYHFFEKTRYEANELNPAESTFHGEAGHDVKIIPDSVPVNSDPDAGLMNPKVMGLPESNGIFPMPVKERKVSVRTYIDVRSNEQNFYILFKRQIFENDKLLREKVWNEIVPRVFQ